MKRRWLVTVLLLIMASSSGCTELSPPTSSTQTGPGLAPTNQADETQAAITESSLTATETLAPTPNPTSTSPPPTTQPPIVLPDPAPIIAKIDGNSNWFLLLGGSQMESWIGAEDVASVIGEDTAYQINTVDENLGWATTNEIVHEQLCDQYYLSLNSLPINKTAVGVTGDWPVTPRKLEEIPTDTEVYLYALADWLVEQSSSQPIVAMKKIWRVDLEGNGTEEVLFNATRFAEPTGHDVEPRDYSVVLLRTVIGNQVATIELVGDFYSEAEENQFPLTYTLEFVGDLNGDGMMEVVIGIQRWEGSGVMVFEIDKDQVNLVLSVICHL